MVHGIGLGGAALIGLAASGFYLYATRRSGTLGESPTSSRALQNATFVTSAMLWLAVIVGTYVVFPPYRVAPPAGVTDLTQYPRALVLANPDTAWLHAFAMESKEHMPWIAAMLATSVAFATRRRRSKVADEASLRRMALGLLAIAFALVAFVSLMGVFVNKVAPLQ
jgi:hypothetical protein